jgi:hypothetical protein
MNHTKKYIIYGPVDTLRRMAPSLKKDIPPKYEYKYLSLGEHDEIHMYVYEEYQRQINSSTSLTLVIELSSRSLKVEMFPTGGRVGFRGSVTSSEQPAYDKVTDFVNDYAARFGLTLQDVTPAPVEN